MVSRTMDQEGMMTNYRRGVSDDEDAILMAIQAGSPGQRSFAD